jgi:glycosyltransferase involved in cell wall biosynthesis
MKVLLATYFTIPQEIGGLWPFISELKAGLEARGYEVDILGRTADGSGYTLYNKNLVIHSDELIPLVQANIEPALHSLHPATYELTRYGLELAAASFGVGHYDLIHCQDVIAGLALSRIKPANIPLVTSVHGSLPHSYAHYLKKISPAISIEECQKTDIYRYHAALEFAGLYKSQLIHTSSLWFRNRLTAQYGISLDKVETFPYGLNISTLERQQPGMIPHVTPDKKIIIFTGRIVHIKGIPYLIDALNKLKKVRNDWQCWIIGDGELGADSVKKAAKFGLHNDVLFLGKRKDIFPLLKKSDIFVLPSLQDNQPYSVMEAQVAGLPSVVTNTGGLPEMVSHGETGIVVPPANSHHLFLGIKHLLQNDKLRTSMGEQAKRTGLVQWSFHTMIDKTIHMYKKLLSSTPPNF